MCALNVWLTSVNKQGKDIKGKDSGPSRLWSCIHSVAWVQLIMAQHYSRRSALLCVVFVKEMVLLHGLQILVMENPPYVCPDWSPCQPAYAGAEWTENSTLKSLQAWKSKSKDLLPGNAIFLRWDKCVKHLRFHENRFFKKDFEIFFHTSIVIGLRSYLVTKDIKLLYQ